MTYYRQCKNHPDIQIHLTAVLVQQNTSKARFTRLFFSDWNKFNLDTHGSNNYSVFQHSLVKFIRLCWNYLTN